MTHEEEIADLCKERDMYFDAWKLVEKQRDIAMSALENCRDVGEQDVVSIVDEALKELKNLG